MHFRHNHGELDTIITMEFVHNKLKMVKASNISPAWRLVGD